MSISSVSGSATKEIPQAPKVDRQEEKRTEAKADQEQEEVKLASKKSEEGFSAVA